jgi:hypothetical protein
MSFGEQVAAGNANHGSTLYNQTWKEWIRLRDYAVYVSEHRCAAHQRAGLLGGPRQWQTRTQPETRRGLQHVSGAARLTGWVTPTSRDWKDTSGMTAQREGKGRVISYRGKRT